MSPSGNLQNVACQWIVTPGVSWGSILPPTADPKEKAGAGLNSETGSSVFHFQMSKSTKQFTGAGWDRSLSLFHPVPQPHHANPKLHEAWTLDVSCQLGVTMACIEIAPRVSVRWLKVYVLLIFVLSHHVSEPGDGVFHFHELGNLFRLPAVCKEFQWQPSPHISFPSPTLGQENLSPRPQSRAQVWWSQPSMTQPQHWLSPRSRGRSRALTGLLPLISVITSVTSLGTSICRLPYAFLQDTPGRRIHRARSRYHTHSSAFPISSYSFLPSSLWHGLALVYSYSPDSQMSPYKMGGVTSARNWDKYLLTPMRPRQVAWRRGTGFGQQRKWEITTLQGNLLISSNILFGEFSATSPSNMSEIECLLGQHIYWNWNVSEIKNTLSLE